MQTWQIALVAQVYFGGQCLRRRLLIKILPLTFKTEMWVLCSLRAYAGAPNYHIHRTHAGERASRPHYKGFIYQKTNYSHAYAIKRRKKSSQRRTRKINFSCYAPRFCLRRLAALTTPPPISSENVNSYLLLCIFVIILHIDILVGRASWNRRRQRHFAAQKVRKPWERQHQNEILFWMMSKRIPFFMCE